MALSSDQICRASGFNAVFYLPIAYQFWDLSEGLGDLQDSFSLKSFWHKHIIFLPQPLLPDLSFAYFM